MLRTLQRMGRGQRIAIFLLLIIGGILALLTLVAFLFLFTVNSTPRNLAIAQQEGLSVAEFAELPDDDAYPAALTVGPDGTVYTGSYAHGAVWAITPLGEVSEVPNTREIVGSITGLEVGPDGTLFILDRLEFNPRSAGGIIWRITDNGLVVEFGVGEDATDFVSPDDIALDPAGNVYVTDRGRRQVWRFDPAGVGALWWVPPADDEQSEEVLPTGIAYDPTREAMLITDSEAGTLYAVSLDGIETEILYRYDGDEEAPSFDGVTVSADGAIYLAALGQRAVVQFQDGELLTLADNFRGISDVAAVDGLIYATNFDGRSLVLPGVQPQLPFALDVIDLDGGE